MILQASFNEKQTKANVRHYFDKELPRLILQSGYSQNEIRSSHLSLAPSFGINLNDRSEDIILNSMEAQEIVKGTLRAINLCHDPYRKILLNVYINEASNNNVQALLGYSHAQYNRLKGKAFICFADAFSNIKDLRVYECLK